MSASEHDRIRHWQDVWSRKPPETTSWYQHEPEMSLTLIEASGLDRQRPVIDVGGGAAPLVDRLLDRGFTDLTVLDIAAEGLKRAQSRLGDLQERVDWIVADVTAWKPERRYALWHDRAVFHFLTERQEQRAYGQVLASALARDGQAVIATFAADGPEKCSGLPVQRHDPHSLLAALGDGFLLLETRRETHLTPGGAEQRFLWCRLGRD